MSEPIRNIKKIKQLLHISNLAIPEYQRPYKWSSDNVNQLFDDIIESSSNNKSAYRIGTVVLHKDINEKKEEKLNIVDGQQRTVTFMLITLAIISERPSDIDCKATETIANDYQPQSIITFRSDISKKNILDNYTLIKRRIHNLSRKDINYFFNNCEVVYVQLDDITEAFQFFDSQNARGKDLDPHDLLKAYHLREMNQYYTDEEKRLVTKEWESIDTEFLKRVFSDYLYRIRQWSNGYSARSFEKKDIGIFKGISPDIHESYPYAKIYRIASFYTDDYNNSMYKKINNDPFNYPYQVDQPVINGKRFFDMITYYSNIVKEIENSEGVFSQYPLLKQITEYDGAWNTGDEFVLSMFRTALLYYYDKFGDDDYLEKSIDMIFAWAYTLRFGLYSVGIDSIDNYAIKVGNGRVQAEVALFKKIKESGTPRQFLASNIPVIIEKDNDYSASRYQDSKDGKPGLRTLLKERHYYERQNKSTNN